MVVLPSSLSLSGMSNPVADAAGVGVLTTSPAMSKARFDSVGFVINLAHLASA